MNSLKLITLLSLLILSASCKKQKEIDALNAQVAALESQVSNLGNLQGEIDVLNGTITAHESTITNLNATIAANDTTIADLNAIIAGLNADATANAAQIASLETTIANLTATNATLATDLAAANSALAIAIANYGTANTEYMTFKADVAGEIFINHPSYSGNTFYLGQSTIDPNVIIIQLGTNGTSFSAINIANIDVLSYLYDDSANFVFDINAQVYTGVVNNQDGTYTFNRYYDMGTSGGSVQGSWTFEETVSTIKDIEKATAAREAKKLSRLTDLLEMEYGFSEKRAVEVTSVISNWKKLSKTREMTSAEANTFAAEVTGANFSQFEEAYLNSEIGNDSLMEELIESAAELNGTSPEAISALLETLN